MDTGAHYTNFLHNSVPAGFPLARKAMTRVGDHSHIATGARLAGSGRSAFVGTGAVVRHGVAIGAGAVAVGNPARLLEGR